MQKCAAQEEKILICSNNLSGGLSSAKGSAAERASRAKNCPVMLMERFVTLQVKEKC